MRLITITKSGRPAKLALLAGMIISIGGLSQAPAHADVPMGGMPSYDGKVDSTGGGTGDSTLSDGQRLAAPAPQPDAEQGGSRPPQERQPPTQQPPLSGDPQAQPKPSEGGANPKRRPVKPLKVRVSCRTSAKTRVRVCRTFKGGALIKICTKRRGRAARCRRISTAAASEPGRLLSSFDPARARGLAKAAAYINNGWVNPASAGIVRLYSTSSPTADKGWCSGSMITRGLVLTAAHCVYDTGEISKANAHWHPYKNGALQAAPGNQVTSGRNTMPYGTWNVAEVFAPPGYTKPYGQSDDTLDWAIVQLLPNASGNYAGDYTGTFSATWSKTITTNTQLWSAGYPASGLFAQASYNFGENQFFCNATPDTILTQGVARILQYPCKGTGGISGGPVWARNDDGSWTIVAVHNRGSQQGDPYIGKDAYNYWMDGRFGDFWNAVITYIRSH